MKKIVVVTLLLLIGIGQPVWAVEAPFTIEAGENIIFNEKDRIIEAKGGIVINLEDGMIKADQMTVFLNKKLIEASGNVVLKQGEDEITGAKLEYNYQTETGKIFNSETKQENINFKGRVIEVKKDTLLIMDSSLTPCIQETPHYKLTAREITIYPEDKLVAKGVWVWGKDIKLFPLFTYKASFEEDETGKRKVTEDNMPRPGFGYNTRDGAFIELDYDHYVSDNLEGEIYTKASSNERHQVRASYDYHPSEKFVFKPKLDYKSYLGLDTSVQLNNKFGVTSSDLSYSTYIEDDEDEADYKERDWKANWKLETKLKDIDLDLKLNKKEDKEDIEQNLQLEQSWSDYFWKLNGSRNVKVNYKPELTLGVRNKKFANGNTLNTSLKAGQIYEEDTGIDTTRQQLNLELKRNDKLTTGTRLRTKGKVTGSNYETGDEYYTQEFSLGVNHKFSALDLGLNYNYYNELGDTPFKFDWLLDDGLGSRHAVGGDIGKKNIKLSNNLKFDWQLFANKNYYETGVELGQYGGSTGLDYDITNYQELKLEYDYQALTGKVPVEGEDAEEQAENLNFIGKSDLEVVNELTATYNFRTNQGEYPYWDNQLKVGYSFIDEEISTLKYSAIRQYDCFNFRLSLDQIEEEVSWGLDFKY